MQRIIFWTETPTFVDKQGAVFLSRNVVRPLFIFSHNASFKFVAYLENHSLISANILGEGTVKKILYALTQITF